MRRQEQQKTAVPKGAQGAGGLTSRVYVHSALREARCLLCGKLHEQQYIAAGLFEGDRRLGDLCPRCLDAGPAKAASRLRQYLNEPSSAAKNDPAGSDVSTPQVPEELASSKATQLPDRTPTGVRQWAPSSDELLTIAEALALQVRWSISLEEVMEEERAVLRQRFSGLREDDIRKLVDERYREYLEQTP